MKKKIFYLIAIVLISGTLVAYLGYLLIFPFTYIDVPVNKSWSSQLRRTIQNISIAQNDTIVAVMTDSIASINLKTGDVIWTSQLSSTSNPYPALVKINVIFLVTDTSLLAFNIHDGTLLWQQSCDCDNSKILDVSDEYIIVDDMSNKLDMYDAISGNLLWSLPAGRGFVDAYIDGHFAYEVDDGIKEIDARTGKMIWETPLDIKGKSYFYNGKLFYEGGNVFVPTDTYIAAFDVHQHIELWKKALDIQGSSDFLANEENLYVSDQNQIYAISVGNGRLMWVANSPNATNMTFVKNKVLALGDFSRTISEFDSSSGKSKAVLQIDLPHLIRVPMQDMIAIEDIFLFSKGNTIYGYAYEE